MKEKIGGIHFLLGRIHNKKRFLDALKAEMDKLSKTDMEKATSALAFSRIKSTKENNYFKKDWNNLKKEYGFTFVPDTFYPGRFTSDNLVKWTNEFVKFFLKDGIEGVRRLFNDIGNFLANYNIDAVCDGYPIIYYSLAWRAEIDVDDVGRATKVFRFPLRFTRKELLESLDDFNRDLEEQVYGEELLLKKIGVEYRYSWGMKPPHKKTRKKILHGYDWTEIFSYKDRNIFIKKRFEELRKQNFSESECYRILAAQFRRAPTTIRQIIKKRVKFS